MRRRSTTSRRASRPIASHAIGRMQSPGAIVLITTSQNSLPGALMKRSIVCDVMLITGIAGYLLNVFRVILTSTAPRRIQIMRTPDFPPTARRVIGRWPGSRRHFFRTDHIFPLRVEIATHRASGRRAKIATSKELTTNRLNVSTAIRIISHQWTAGMRGEEGTSMKVPPVIVVIPKDNHEAQ